VHTSLSGTFKPSVDVRHMVACGGKPDSEQTSPNDRG
jgi:hypothetical protein